MNSLIAFGLLCLLACVSAQYGNSLFTIESAWFTSESCAGMTPNVFEFGATGICLPEETEGGVVGTISICNTGPGFNTSVYSSPACGGSPIEQLYLPGGCIAEGGVGTSNTCGKVPIYANWCHITQYGAPACAGPALGGEAASVGFCIPSETGFISVWPNATTLTMTMKICSDYMCKTCNSTILPLGCYGQSTVAVWCYGANGQLISGSTTGVQTTTGAHTTTGAAHTTTGAAHTTTGAAYTTTTGAAHTTTGAAHTTTGAAHTTTGAAHGTTTAAGVKVFAGFGSVVLLLVALLF